MINLKKRLIFVFFIVLLIAVSGCISGKKDVTKSLEQIRTGTEGIVVNFVPNNPPDKVYVEGNTDENLNKFDVVLELRNKGAFPQPEDTYKAPKGLLFLSGYDPNIIDFTVKEPKSEAKVVDLGRVALEGKSTINPNGGQDIVSFEGKIISNNLNVQKYEPVLLATVCYNYETVAGPVVCIDPDPYSTLKEKKVCQVQDTVLSNQGAPIAITRIDEEAFAAKTQFKITIKNVGNGDAMKPDSETKCNPIEGPKLEREDIDKVQLQGVIIRDKPLECGPFADSTTQTATTEKGIIRLINGEGFVVCKLNKEDYGKSNTAFTTPLTIRLGYAYRTTAQRSVQINKESGASGVASGSN